MHQRGGTLHRGLGEAKPPCLWSLWGSVTGSCHDQAVEQPQGIRMEPVMLSIVNQGDKGGILMASAPGDSVVLSGLGRSHLLKMGAVALTGCG